MSSSRTLSRKFRTSFTCIKPRFDPSIILLYIAASVEQYCDITQLNALPENEGILEIPSRFHLNNLLITTRFSGFFRHGWGSPSVCPWGLREATMDLEEALIL